MLLGLEEEKKKKKKDRKQLGSFHNLPIGWVGL